MIGGFHTAAQHQTTGIHSVNKAIVQFDGMTRQNAALVERSAAASMSLREQTRRLAETVAVFRLQAA